MTLETVALEWLQFDADILPEKRAALMVIRNMREEIDAQAREIRRLRLNLPENVSATEWEIIKELRTVAPERDTEGLAL